MALKHSYSDRIILVALALCVFCLHIVKCDIKDLDSYCSGSLPEDDNYSECYHVATTGRFLNIIDSINTLWCVLDKDESDYLSHEEILENIKENSMLQEEDAINRAKMYLQYLDDNLDSVVSVYELRFNLHRIANLLLSNAEKESLPEYERDFHHWIKQFAGESPQKFPFYLVKLFQMMDEDLNGKLTWKEIRMTIKMTELFGGISEAELMDEETREILVSKIKKNNQNKWLDLDEFLALLLKLQVRPDGVFYNWIIEYLEGNSDYSTASESVRNQFNNIDTNLDGIISKGELIATLHKHRKDYYTDVRINRRFTRADRNGDGIISFNEYAFLENLKHPTTK